MDINKYILGQIKIDEKLMKMVDIQENTPTKVIKKDPKQQSNSFLLDKINEDIKNQSRLTNHYKSIATGKPVINEDDNIRLINSNQSVPSPTANDELPAIDFSSTYNDEEPSDEGGSADAPGFGDDIGDVPIDGGISLLVGAGFAYGAARLRKKKEEDNII